MAATGKVAEVECAPAAAKLAVPQLVLLDLSWQHAGAHQSFRHFQLFLWGKSEQGVEGFFLVKPRRRPQVTRWVLLGVLFLEGPEFFCPGWSCHGRMVVSWQGRRLVGWSVGRPSGCFKRSLLRVCPNEASQWLKRRARTLTKACGESACLQFVVGEVGSYLELVVGPPSWQY